MSIYPTYREKLFEPVKRNKDGMRWIMHRFPIKGGISIRDIMMIETRRENPLMKLVRLREAA